MSGTVSECGDGERVQCVAYTHHQQVGLGGRRVHVAEKHRLTVELRHERLAAGWWEVEGEPQQLATQWPRRSVEHNHAASSGFETVGQLPGWPLRCHDHASSPDKATKAVFATPSMCSPPNCEQDEPRRCSLWGGV